MHKLPDVQIGLQILDAGHDDLLGVGDVGARQPRDRYTHGIGREGKHRVGCSCDRDLNRGLDDGGDHRGDGKRHVERNDGSHRPLIWRHG